MNNFSWIFETELEYDEKATSNPSHRVEIH